MTNIAAKYNSAIAVCDVAVWKDDKNKIEILLGRKHKEDKFRFVGGFISIEDESILAGAKRELREEAGDIEVGDWKFIANSRMNDPRYIDDKDRLFTTFYKCKYIFGRPQGADDIAEVKWFDIDEIKKEEVMEVHHGLLDLLIKSF